MQISNWICLRGELNRRKKELEAILEVLTKYNLDEVCREIGEIDYLIGKDNARYGSSSGTGLQG